MTIDEFFTELRQLTGAHFDGACPKGWIRLVSDDNPTNVYCPITAVAARHGHKFNVAGVYKASSLIGLSDDDAAAIVDAADWLTRPDLRQQMLAALSHLRPTPHHEEQASDDTQAHSS